jgi:raffinose/stachyose/melibiose transport system substrate-binding protein
MKKIIGTAMMLILVAASALSACTPAATATLAPTNPSIQPTSVPNTPVQPTTAPNTPVEPTTAPTPITLVAWLVDGEANTKFIKGNVDIWNKNNPNVQIDLNMYESDPYKTALPVALASDTPPDILFNWMGDDTGTLIREGHIIDLTPYIQKYHWDDGGVSKAAMNAFTYDGKLYGLPYSQEAKYYFYNLDILKKYNITPPQTFDQLIGVCKTLRTNNIVPMSFGNSGKWPGCHYMSQINQKVVGTKVIDSDYNLKTPADQLFTDPNYVKALDKLLELQSAGCFADGTNASDHNVAWAQFYSGQVAMTYEGTWGLAVWDSNGMKDKYGMFRFPEIPDGAGSQNTVLGGPIAYEISSKSKHPDEAASFINFMINPDSQRTFVTLTSRIPVRAAVLDPKIDSPSVIWVAQDLAKADGTTGWLDAVLENSISEIYLNGIQEVLGGTMTPQQVMDAVRAQALKIQATQK